MAELQALADGRADLLAEMPGIFEGTPEGELDEALARCATRLCRLAGADPEAIPEWVQEGLRRRAAARMPPPSGGVQGDRVSHRTQASGRTVCSGTSTSMSARGG